MPIATRRFVTASEKINGHSPWAFEEWLCRGDVVANKELLLVRVTIDPKRCHAFHTHPNREELLYVLSGRAEQWVGQEHRIIGPGEVAFVPKGEVHGTYNVFDDSLVFLAILAPSDASDPALVDVSKQDPWAGLRKGMTICT